jgi:hypothetical protein
VTRLFASVVVGALGLLPHAPLTTVINPTMTAPCFLAMIATSKSFTSVILLEHALDG